MYTILADDKWSSTDFAMDRRVADHILPQRNHEPQEWGNIRIHCPRLRLSLCHYDLKLSVFNLLVTAIPDAGSDVLEIKLTFYTIHGTS